MLVLYLPANIMHSNVLAPKRRQHIEEFPLWLKVLKSAGIPITVSFQTVDLEMLGRTTEDFNGLELLRAPYGHLMMSLYSGHPVMREHAKWQILNGITGNTNGFFFPEFDVPTSVINIQGKPIVPVLPDPSSVLYSSCDSGDINPEAAISQYPAVSFNGMTLVPMVGVAELQKKFFMWQRFPDDREKLDALMSEVQTCSSQNATTPRILFLDLEAPLVGSHHGLPIWERFFAEIRQRDLQRCFTSFEEASQIWRRQQVSAPGVSSLIARDLVKWTRRAPQIQVTDRIKTSVHRKGGLSDRLVAQLTTSDLLSALGSKLEAKITLTADQGPLEIGYDQSIIDMGFALLAAVEQGRDPIAALRNCQTSEDGQWFMNRLADVLNSSN